MRCWLAPVHALRFCVVYSIEGHEAEVALVDYCVGWLREIRSELGTGEWTYQLFAIQIPCFSMTHPLYGPWTVAAYMPLGAIVFLQRRWKMKVSGASIPSPVQTEKSGPD